MYELCPPVRGEAEHQDDPIKECVRCGKEVTNLISPPAIMFKGSGWYITDYSDKMKPGGSDTAEKWQQRPRNPRHQRPVRASASAGRRSSDDLHDQRRARDKHTQLRDIQLEFHLSSGS